jgi:hypothetical protein
MSDETKELTLRVHDECMSYVKRPGRRADHPLFKVMGPMSSDLTFARASHTLSMPSRNVYIVPSEVASVS